MQTLTITILLDKPIIKDLEEMAAKRNESIKDTIALVITKYFNNLKKEAKDE